MKRNKNRPIQFSRHFMLDRRNRWIKKIMYEGIEPKRAIKEDIRDNREKQTKARCMRSSTAIKIKGDHLTYIIDKHDKIRDTLVLVTAY